jgi:peptidoglycan/LPS O-acetylase OafA/YrhL
MATLMPGNHSAAGTHRIAALDGLRALAILLVVPHNIDMFVGVPSWVEFPAIVYMHAGWIGVQLFFVLSGFLITGKLLDTRGQPNYFGQFFARRAWRILPLYFAILLVAMVIVPAMLDVPPALRATLHNQVWLWTFLTNWTQPYGIDVHGFGHFWSLAVEEQFYLLWPLVVLQCAAPRLLRVCVALVLVTLAIRVVMELLGFPHGALYMFTICRMDALALGAMVAAMVRMPGVMQAYRTSASTIMGAALVALAVLALLTHAFDQNSNASQSVGYTVLACGFAAATFATVLPQSGWSSTLMKVLAAKPLAMIARYSYGMYLIHLPLHVYFGDPLLRRFYPVVPPAVGFAYVLVMLVVVFTLAMISYELFERRFLDFQRAPAVTEAPSAGRSAP